MLELCYVLHKLSSDAVYFNQQYCSQTNANNHSYKPTHSMYFPVFEAIITLFVPLLSHIW